MGSGKIGILGKIFGGMAKVAGKGYALKLWATIAPVIVVWSFNSLTKAYPGRAANILKSILNNFFATSGTGAQAIASYLEQMTGIPIPVDQLVGKPVKGWTDSATRAFVDTIFNDILNTILPTPEETKSAPLQGAERFMSTNLKFQMDSWWLHVIADIYSLGMFKSLKDLPNAISWGLGLGWLSWLALGPSFQASVVAPMTRYFNKIYTPSRPDAGQLVRAAIAEIIDTSTYQDRMRELGYGPDDATMLFHQMRIQWSKSELAVLYQLGLWTEDAIKAEYKRVGYPEPHASTQTYLTIMDRYLTIRSKIYDQLISSYSSGCISDSDLTDYLTTLGYKQNEMDLTMVLAKLKRDESGKVTNADYLSLVHKGQMSMADFTSTLNQRGFSNTEAGQYILANSPDITLADYNDLYKKGQVSDSQMLSILKQRGYSESDSLLLLQVAKPELTLINYIDLLKKGLVGADSVISIMMAREYTRADAVAYIKAHLTASELKIIILPG